TVGHIYVFSGSTVSHLLTSDNLGTEDAGAPLHTAYYDQTGVYQGQTYQGVIDLMNVGSTNGYRNYVPTYVAAMLHDAYGYSVVSPDTFGTAYAILDPSNGALLIHGGSGGSNDTITLSVSGSQLVVSVSIGNAVPGTGLDGLATTHPAPFVSQFPLSS